MNENVKYFFNRLYDKMFEENTFGYAATVAFYFSFSIFPLLIFLVSIFGLVLESADEFRIELFEYLRQIMPRSAYELVAHTIEEVMQSSSGGKITLGILIALWSASAGVDSLRGALNEVYKLKETRQFWKTRPLSVFLTFALGIFILIALGIIFYGSQFLVWMLAIINLPIPSPFFLGVLKWTTVLGVLLLAFALVYNVAPNRQTFRWQWITPGAMTGIILWLLVSNGFRIYLQYFDTYSKTYGSLGAMMVLMLWLYLTALVILIGAVINQILEEIYDKMNLVEAAETIASDDSKPINEPMPSFEKAAATSDISVLNLKGETPSTKIQTENTTDLPAQPPKIDEKPKEAVKSEIAEQVSTGSKTKPIVGFTVAGVFVVMMGLMFRKKFNKS